MINKCFNVEVFGYFKVLNEQSVPNFKRHLLIKYLKKKIDKRGTNGLNIKIGSLFFVKNSSSLR